MINRLSRKASRVAAKRLHCAVALVLFLCAARLYCAQTEAGFTGTVTNAATGIPIAGATVRVDGVQRARVTESDGRYRLTAPPGKREVRVTAIGFAPFSRTEELVGGKPVTVDVALQPNPTMLDAVVAVGTRRQDRTLAESPVPVDIISGDLADNTGMTSTPEQLQRLVPAVNMPHVPIGDLGYRPVSLRGLEPDHVLVLVNGKRRHPAAALLQG